MASSPSWLPRIAEAFGAAAGAPPRAEPLGGGTWRVTLPGGVAAAATELAGTELAGTEAAGGVPAGLTVVAKVGPGVGDEADGLRRIAAVPGAPAVPAVLLAEGDLLVTSWVAPGPRTAAAEAELGRRLAALHSAPAPAWGGGSSWIGACRVDPSPAPDGPAFYGRRLTELAAAGGLGAVVEPVVRRLPELVLWEGPAVLHGDLWWGNVLWGAGGAPWLIDPSAHGGHPEEDLGMLALFGAVPPGLLAAYHEARPLADGWRHRVALWQLVPLLVHTVLFGGGYRAQAAAAARRYR